MPTCGRPSRGYSLASLLTGIIAVCVLPLIGAAIALAAFGVERLQSERDADALATATNFATAIDEDLQARIAALRMLASAPEADDPARWPELHRLGRAFEASFGSHVILAESGEPMRMLLNTRVPLGAPLPALPRPQGHAAAPAALATGKPAVGDLFVGPIAHEPLVAIAVPVPHPIRTRRVLLTTPEARVLQRRVDRLSLPADWTLRLLDGQGQVIARRRPAAPEAAADDDAQRYRVDLRQAPWAVELRIPQAVRLREARQAAVLVAMSIGPAALLALGGALFATRRLRAAVDALWRPRGDTSPIPIAEFARARRQLDDAASARDAAQAAEREAQERSRTTFELANVGIAQLAPDGRWLRVNRRLCEIVGYGEDELLALRFQDITHPDDLAADAEYVRRLLAGEIPAYAMDKRYLRKDGSGVWVRLAVTLARDGAGGPDYFISVVEDITPRKRLEARDREQIDALARSEAEVRRLLALATRSRAALLDVLEDERRVTQSLRQSEAYRRRLFEHLADGVLLLDAEGRIHDANPHAAAMLGCAVEDLLDRPIDAFVAEKDRPQAARAAVRATAGDGPLSEWTLVRRDGSSLQVEVSAGPVDTQRHVAVLRDVSLRRAAEEALLRTQSELSNLTQRLLAQERTTTMRVAQALHDRLGQTLAVARLRLGTLSMRRTLAPPAETDAALGELGRLLQQAVVETRQVLSDLRPPLLEEQGLGTALDNEVQRLAKDTGGPTLQELEVAPGAAAHRYPPEVEYAAFMVVREALANALAHAQAATIRVLLDGDADWLRLEVRDDGVGLPAGMERGRPGHLGVVGMRERAVAIGAEFRITGRTGEGTEVTLEWNRDFA